MMDTMFLRDALKDSALWWRTFDGLLATISSWRRFVDGLMVIILFWYLDRSLGFLAGDRISSMNLYDRFTFYICHRIVCGFITGSCYSLSFPISPLWQRMTWKQNILMGLFISHSSMQIGKILFVTWMRGYEPTTTTIMKKCPSLDWFGWVNVWWPNFRNFCHSGVIGVWFVHWDI